MPLPATEIQTGPFSGRKSVTGYSFQAKGPELSREGMSSLSPIFE